MSKFLRRITTSSSSCAFLPNYACYTEYCGHYCIPAASRKFHVGFIYWMGVQEQSPEIRDSKIGSVLQGVCSEDGWAIGNCFISVCC